MNKDINNTREFHEWLRQTFNYVDSSVKSLMYRAWCARRKTLLKKEPKVNKYYIEYQLEDEAPTHKIVKGKNTKDAVVNLEKKVREELEAEELEEEEVSSLVEGMMILECYKV